MKKLVFSFLILTLAMNLVAQPKRAKERISTLKKVKLLEVLDLDESTSEKVLLKYNAWENKIEDQMEKIDEVEEELVKAIKKGNKEDIKNISSKFEKERDKIVQIAMERDKDMKSILTDEQYAKYLIFEKRFRRELGEQLMKRRGRD